MIDRGALRSGAVLALFLVAGAVAAEDWMPVDPAHLALKEPKVEKGADAEAMFWEIRVDDEVNENYARAVRRHYVRVKIFTERGKETQAKVDLLFPKNVYVGDIEARTIKPDGQILLLKKEDVHERVMVKRRRGKRLSAKSFALPGVEPGAIVEYRWKETYMDTLTNYAELPIQRDVPTWQVRYYVKPLEYFPYPMRSLQFGVEKPAWVPQKYGYYGTVFNDVPAFKEEPHMPPEDEARAWMLVYYTEPKDQKPEQFWRDYGREIYKWAKDDLKPHAEVTAAAQKAVEGATTDEEKLARLVEFCRTRIKNVSDDAIRTSEADEKGARKNRSPRETLARGVGNSGQIDVLFAAMAAALGFDTRLAMTADRSEIFFEPAHMQPHFLTSFLVAVREGEKWKLYEPSSRYASKGMLRWQNEGLPVLVSDPKEPFFMDSPFTPAEKSVVRRTGRFKLAADGSLQGRVRLEYSGHSGYIRKESYDGMTREKREEAVREMVKELHGNAEVSEVELDNVTDPERPLSVAYQVRVPEYAQRTGKRLLLQPAYFQKGRAATFTAQERRHPVMFDYPWSEQDDVQIELPEGFELDHPQAPAGVSIPPVAEYGVTLKIARATSTRTLIFERRMQFGGPGYILFPQERYAGVKKVFDSVHAGDGQVLSLKAAEAGPAASAR